MKYFIFIGFFATFAKYSKDGPFKLFTVNGFQILKTYDTLKLLKKINKLS